MLVRFTFPIDNYYGDSVFEKQVYFECSRCPTLEQIKQALETSLVLERASWAGLPGYVDAGQEYAQCLETLKYLERPNDFPHVVEGHLVQTNCFVNHPKWGRQPLTATIIQPIKEDFYASRHEEGDCQPTETGRRN